MDESVWQSEPYTPQDFTNQVNWAAANLPDGQQIISGRGPTTWRASTPTSPHAKNPLNTLTMMPAEYAAIGQPLGPQPFTVEDVVKIATLVGGIFGNGGGQQLSNAVLYEGMKAQFGPERVNVAGLARADGVASPERKKKRKGKPKRSIWVSLRKMWRTRRCSPNG